MLMSLIRVLLFSSLLIIFTLLPSIAQENSITASSHDKLQQQQQQESTNKISSQIEPLERDLSEISKIESFLNTKDDESEIGHSSFSAQDDNNQKNGYGDGDADGHILCPVTCFRPDPVCGSDDVTYWCGHRDALCGGADVAYLGFCKIHSFSASSQAKLGFQALFLLHIVWLLVLGVCGFLDLL